MPFNGSGKFNTALTFIPNTLATAEDQNTQDQDIAAGLSDCMTRDGQAPATANISMGGFQLNDVQDPSVNSDAATKNYVDTQISDIVIPSMIVANIAALKVLVYSSLTTGYTVYVSGYFTPGAGGGGFFVWNSTSTYSDNGGTVINPTGNGGSGRWLREIGPLNLLEFGADNTGGASSSTPILNWINESMNSGSYQFGQPLYAPEGTYLDTNRSIDLIDVYGTGFLMYGDGMQKTIFNLGTGKWNFICSGNGGGAFYGVVRDIGFLTLNSSGPCVEFGSANFSDAMNGFSLTNLLIKNTSTGTTPGFSSDCCALRLNEVYSSEIVNLTCNTGTVTDSGSNGAASLRLTQSSFNRISGSYSASSIGVHLTYSTALPYGPINGGPTTYGNGYNFGNVFTNLDLEVCYYCIQSDSYVAGENVFISGQYVTGANSQDEVGAILNATSGNVSYLGLPYLPSGNKIISGNGFGTSNAVLSAVGFTLENPINVATPAFPATFTDITTVYKNTTGYKVTAFVTGGVITKVDLFSPGSIYSISGSTTNSSANVIVSNTINLQSGFLITGPGIPAGTTISSITNTTTFVISASATATASGVNLTIYDPTGFVPNGASTGFLTIPLNSGWSISFTYSVGSGQPGWAFINRD